MSNLIRTIFSALRQWDASQLRAPESGAKADSRYVASPLPRHRVSLTATASFGMSGIPEEIWIRDINEKGLYFYTNFDLPIGASLDILAVLPPDIRADGKGRRVHYEAKVIRVERECGKEQYGVGASIRRCETFPLPTTTSRKRPPAAPIEVRVPAPQSIQPTKAVQEKLPPAPKATTQLRIPKVAEPAPIPKTTAPVPIQKIAVPGKETLLAPLSIQKMPAPVEKTIAPVVEIRASAVIDDAAASDRKVTIQYRRAVVEKLATAALRAGISLEELVHLIDSGITPTEVVDIIETRLMSRAQ
jgi:hypothetical protein